MLDALRAWLNGKRDYFIGVALFAKLSDNKKLLSLLQNGPTAFNVKRLQDELTAICKKMKEEAPEPEAVITAPSSSRINPPKIKLQTIAADLEPVNPVLYQSCKKTADKEYKEAMNLRAQLFALANVGEFEDPNNDALVKSRSSLALRVVELYNKSSRLYDQADYVKINGRLPGDDADQDGDPENEYNDLPDHLVYYTLDLMRKSYNKLNAKPKTPERLQKLQMDDKNIKKLEARWLLLKPRQRLAPVQMCPVYCR